MPNGHEGYTGHLEPDDDMRDIFKEIGGNLDTPPTDQEPDTDQTLYTIPEAEPTPIADYTESPTSTEASPPQPSPKSVFTSWASPETDPAHDIDAPYALEQRPAYFDKEGSWSRVPDDEDIVDILQEIVPDEHWRTSSNREGSFLVPPEHIGKAHERKRSQDRQLAERQRTLDTHVKSLEDAERDVTLHRAAKEHCINSLEHEILKRDGEEAHPFLSRLNQLFYDDLIPALEKEAGGGIDDTGVKAVISQVFPGKDEDWITKNFEKLRRTHPEVRQRYMDFRLVPRIFKRVKAAERQAYGEELTAWAEAEEQQAREESLDTMLAAGKERGGRLLGRIRDSFMHEVAVEEVEEAPKQTKFQRDIAGIDLMFEAETQLSKRAKDELVKRLGEIRENVLVGENGIYESLDNDTVIKETAKFLGIKEFKSPYTISLNERDEADQNLADPEYQDENLRKDKVLSLRGRASMIDPETDPVRIYQDNLLMPRHIGEPGELRWSGYFTNVPGGKPFRGAIVSENELTGLLPNTGRNPGRVEIEGTLRWVTERTMKALLGELYKTSDVNAAAEEWYDPTLIWPELQNRATREVFIPGFEKLHGDHKRIEDEVKALRSQKRTQEDILRDLQKPALPAAQDERHQLEAAPHDEEVIDAEVVLEENSHLPQPNGHGEWRQF
jgi:hypothetical protein